MPSDATPQRDFSSLCAEFQSLVQDVDGDSSTLEPGSLTDLLKDCKLQPDELKLRIHKFNIVMKNSKQFLDSCDTFLQSLANVNAILGPVYGAVKFIVTIAAAKSEILDEVLAGLNDVFDGLPLITHSVKMSNSNPENRAIISALIAFVTLVKDVKDYRNMNRLDNGVMRTFKSTTILRDVRDARKKMREALDLARFGTLVNYIKDQSDRHMRLRIGAVLERLHCTNYEYHLAQYIAKTSSIEHPCAWSDSHPSIIEWLSHEASQLFITGRPGTGKSVFTAHMIQKVAKIPKLGGHRGGALLYYFCGADPTVDPYSNLPQKASFKAVAMSFLRQLLSKEHRKSIADVTLLDDLIDYVLSSQSDKYQEEDLKRWVIRLLESFDTVWIIVDAVDQCEVTQPGRGLTPWILHNFTTQYAHLLLVSSEGSREDKLLAGWPRVTLGTSGTTQADLEAYSRHVVRSYLPEGHPLDETLVQDIVKRSENMLLYVFFLENLITQDDMPMFLADKRIEFLQKTPPGIFKMYSYYLHVQLQGFARLPPGSGFDRVLEILLKLVVFSPSAVTWDIFLEILQSSSLPSDLALTRENIDAIARRAAGVLFDIREATVREDSRSSRQHLVPVHRTLAEYFQSSDYPALRVDSNLAGGLSPVLGQLEVLYKSVAETGPSSLLEICCVALQDRKFQHSLNRYHHTADLCRQCLDDSSTRGV
ncbi:Nacht and ankyrin domain protein [Mycena sanguinolenta]|uniref:Nacht and ankyrin domain protein n=1 Tax=Mycena sanguinolenta TaxID=230812 RepID=A0A8H7CNP3_9AGAR|nr:Nacht and ankyrin domain protein [Mycena sanguinolenta]